MAQKYNPATGQWEDDTTTSTGGDPTVPAMPFPAPQPDVIPRAQLPSGPTIQDAGVDRSTGGVAQTQAGYSPVVGADLQTRQAGADTSFTNGNTGASAHYDPATGMYIDTNGQSIRPDAIRTSNPAAYAGQAGGGGAAPAAPSFTDQIRKILMDRLAQAQTPVDPNAPEIAATMSAASDAGTRASDAERTALAERLYAQGGGLNTDALGRQIQQSGEKQASTLSTLKASLLTNQYNQKRQELQSLLSMAIQSGDAESARAIQMQMANLQAAVQREGLGINLAEFGATMNQNSVLAGLRG